MPPALAPRLGHIDGVGRSYPSACTAQCRMAAPCRHSPNPSRRMPSWDRWVGSMPATRATPRGSSSDKPRARLATPSDVASVRVLLSVRTVMVGKVPGSSAFMRPRTQCFIRRVAASSSRLRSSPGRNAPVAWPSCRRCLADSAEHLRVPADRGDLVRRADRNRTCTLRRIPGDDVDPDRVYSGYLRPTRAPPMRRCPLESAPQCAACGPPLVGRSW
jgi:hypothetical protein